MWQGALAWFSNSEPPLCAEAASPITPIAVAYSGGADSTALLLAAHTLWPDRICALHVNHGLQAAADHFFSHAQDFCQARAIPLHCTTVQIDVQPGDSVEEKARHARYPALATMAQAIGAKVVLLAQHADDQVETMLLALSRGAGLPGLAGMPALFTRNGMCFVRPLLDISASDIRSHLQHSKVPYIEDPMNSRPDIVRSRLRHGVLPALSAACPQYRKTFARSAQHIWQAQLLLQELAEQDLAQAGLPPQVQQLRQLSPARLTNVLRYWLHQHHSVSASTAQTQELVKQIQSCTTRGHRIRLKVAAGMIQLEKGALHYVPSSKLDLGARQTI